MTQEDKQLLLKDLCARLPYGVKFQGEDSNVYTLDAANYFALQVENVVYKPYLRPMSSMTEEEERKYYDLTHQEEDDVWAKCLFDRIVDFCNERHLDYRGLIEKGLALEASKDMYKTE